MAIIQTSLNSIITKNLTGKEVACPCCDAVLYDDHFVDNLQVLRNIMGIPFYYKPGGFYRCGMYQKTLKNGATNSYHPLCLACDILIKGWNGLTHKKFISNALHLGFSIGIYTAHFHIDMRKTGQITYPGSY